MDLFSQTKYDLTDCLSNCSNHGLCKLGENNKLKCQCESTFFIGSKCDVDLRTCSYSPCLNSIKCENIYPESNNNQKDVIDFKCHCKSDKYYGKRCESKVVSDYIKVINVRLNHQK